MKETNHLTVKYHGRTVGTIAETKDGRGAFAYSREWLNEGFSVSPLSLPLEEKVFLPKTDLLEGLFGVFADSLPDGWGRLLVDRMLLSKKISPAMVSAIERLGIVGSMGMGALEYEPELWKETKANVLDFDRLAKECERVLKEKDSRDLDYRDLMKLTWMITKDERELEQMYRRMCFNVFAHNRDDHSKNFSYLYDEEEKRWKLTPAYDLTYSNSIGGEHATCVNGNGRNPVLEDLIAVGEEAGFDRKKLKNTAEEIAEIIHFSTISQKCVMLGCPEGIKTDLPDSIQ